MLGRQQMPEGADDLQQMSGDRRHQEIDRIITQFCEPPCTGKERPQKEQRTINESLPPHCLSVGEPRNDRTNSKYRCHAERYHDLP